MHVPGWYLDVTTAARIMERLLWRLQSTPIERLVDGSFLDDEGGERCDDSLSS